MNEQALADVGATLRAARERRGTSLREIATATKIPVSALEALEANQLGQLPGIIRFHHHQLNLLPFPLIR